MVLLEAGLESDLMTANEVSEYLRIPKSTVYKLVQEGQIPGFKVGRHWRFSRGALDQWISGGLKFKNQTNKLAPKGLDFS
jgi:excisionase family DNA binding protein